MLSVREGGSRLRVREGDAIRKPEGVLEGDVVLLALQMEDRPQTKESRCLLGAGKNKDSPP